MARTRLFGALKRWARLAWVAERQKRPTRECVEQVSATWRSTRRMEGACATGAFAVRAVLNDLGARLSPDGLQYARAAWQRRAPPLPPALPAGELREEVVLTR
jgi:hypothetical protein